ncbi:aminotransferase class IV [Rivularia sp. UHCC 0363]|uniref:aminotransferase class IV n=1 Tax=Rivularia sp. UHCC 0363 TaxID=3110244 RepID=UPI002B2155F5|nr:aminotransferase class IV [Rivularia sp. UHCC 0363]MEA5597298.1 aminotransferase class IV [Rivularia sp. UHCC 0363]
MYWYNGELIESETIQLPINEPGLLFGATIFTTLRVYNNSLNNRLTHWEAHQKRLLDSVQKLDFQQPDWQNIRRGASILINHYPILRITLFPDGKEWITGRLLTNDLTQRQKYGVNVAIAKTEQYRSLPLHKTGNYLAAWLAKSQALKQNIQQNIQEAILTDAEGNWLETTTGNLWGWRDRCWFTPPLSAGILPGIMREQLLNWLIHHQYQVKEEPFTPKLVQELVAIAYSNCVVEILPIHQVIHPTGKLQYDPSHYCFKELRKYLLA